MKKEKIDEELREEAIGLGISMESSYNADGSFREGAIQERVRRSKEIKLAQKMWIVALVSAIASVISALAAWFAVMK